MAIRRDRLRIPPDPILRSPLPTGTARISCRFSFVPRRSCSRFGESEDRSLKYRRTMRRSSFMEIVAVAAAARRAAQACHVTACFVIVEHCRRCCGCYAPKIALRTLTISVGLSACASCGGRVRRNLAHRERRVANFPIGTENRHTAAGIIGIPTVVQRHHIVSRIARRIGIAEAEPVHGITIARHKSRSSPTQLYFQPVGLSGRHS